MKLSLMASRTGLHTLNKHPWMHCKITWTLGGAGMAATGAGAAFTSTGAGGDFATTGAGAGAAFTCTSRARFSASNCA